MVLLFFDVYYVNDDEMLIGFYEIAKDFVVPSVAIIVPILITLYITARDRKINAKNRAEDQKRYEEDKKNIIEAEVLKKRILDQEVISNFKFFFVSMKDTLSSNLVSMSDLINHATIEKLPSLSVSIFANRHLNALENLDNKVLMQIFEKRDFAQYLTSIRIIEDLYNELNNTTKEYRRRNIELINEVEAHLNNLFFEMDIIFVDEIREKKGLNNLFLFRVEYNKYVEQYNSLNDMSFPAYIKNKVLDMIDIEFFTSIRSYPTLTDIIRELEMSIHKMDRLCANLQHDVITIKKGMEKHKTVLERIKIYENRLL